MGPRIDEPFKQSNMVLNRIHDLKPQADLSSSDVGKRDDVVSAGLTTEDSLAWGSLPADILEHALVFLPFPQLFQLRSVCKRWNSLIHCVQFQKNFSGCPVSWGHFHSPRLGWKGVASPVVPWSAYDLSKRKWVTMPDLVFPAVASSFTWNLISANGGLLFFGANDGRRILVCNPMTKRWRELSCVSSQLKTPVLSHVVVDEDTNSYKILCAGNATVKEFDDRYGMVDVYDSMSDTWKIAGRLPADLSLKSGAYSNGFYYCLTRHHFTGLYRVVTLDCTLLTWSAKWIPIPEGYKNHPYIVACADHVYLVGGQGDRMPMSSIGIFELDPSSGKWNKVGEYRDIGFLHSTGAIYGCGALGTKIFVVTYAYDMWVAVYNISEGLWEEPIKGNFYDLKDIFETRFAFQPNVRVIP